ncbi:MAG: xanthine dehydrogenase family protein molybdopterin-binding subunit [Herminiimonas sp.]|nr:xanthine dehydrogenase family protein molybdopterin-binding subunit [Herminiimonas sp.]
MNIIGQGINRRDGRAKVMGVARYSAEHPLPRMAHAVIVTSTIASGRIASIDASAATAMTGVLQVMTHLNAPKLPAGGKAASNSPPAGRVLNLLQDDRVLYNNQPVALVVADTLEHARAAAQHVRIRYRSDASQLDFTRAKAQSIKPKKANDKEPDTRRGDLATGSKNSVAQIDATYTTPFEHHNPMEPHATIAVWEGDSLTLYDSTQYVTGARNTVAKTLGISPDKVRVICPYVGGGFGCKGSVWSHVVLAAMAARQAGQPVKLVLDRPQMFGPVGHRPNTEQRFMLTAASDGQFTSMRHDVHASTSFQEDWLEPSALATRILYACPNQQTSHRIAKLNTGTPTFMRAPGEASGMFALESAIDEMAYALKMDPIQLRLKNHADTNPEDGKPWSSKSLRECYRTGAERFGWASRNPQPRSMRKGEMLVGMGMATATYPANRSAATASASLLPDGTALVRSGSQDLGTGTYTVMAQVAADALGLPVDRVRFELGDSAMPKAPVSGGSQSVASVAPAVRAAATAVRLKLIGLAIADPASPLSGTRVEDVLVENGWLIQRADTQRREPFAAVIARQGGAAVESTMESKPGKEKETYSHHSFGAVFVEVHVDPDLGTIHVERVVGSYGIGRLLNQKTGHSQLMGGIVWGVGMALQEKSDYDQRTGRIVNGNLGEYHVPVNADIRTIDVIVVDENDVHINSLGAKGIGEIGITGVGAAIANAVYHATGKRIRDLPITLDKLI